MATVWLADDLKHERLVALKVLRPEVGAILGAERFLREIRLTARLQHPHIVPIFDSGAVGSGEVGRWLWYTMPYIRGESLRQRLRREVQLPVDDALEITRQVALALDYAHQEGAVHRDIKPENILLSEGQAMVADFGIALAIGAGGAEHITGTGLALGTPAYMAPEQASGGPIDRRADVYALGCVLYEMLAGEPPFAGATGRAIMARRLAQEPPSPQVVRPTVPDTVDQAIRKAMAIVPADRFATAAQLAQALGASSRVVVAAPAIPVPARGLPRRRPGAIFRPAGFVGVGLLVVAAAVGLFHLRSAAPVTSPAEYLAITNFTESAVAPSLSPDGRMVTFKVGEDFFLGSGDIYVKVLPTGESVPLTSGGGPKYGPAFSPDGSRITYTRLTGSTQGLSWDTWTVPVLGGPPTRLLPNASGLTWVDDHRVLFAEIRTGLHMGIVTATEGRAEERDIYFPANEGAMAHYAYASPDRRWLLVVEMDQSHAFRNPCRLVPFDGSSPGRQVGPAGTCTSAAWSPDGRWMYFSATVAGRSHLWRQRFPEGAPVQITFGATDEEGVTIAPDGRSLVTSLGTRRSAVWIHDMAGERALTTEGFADTPRLSRDGRRVFYLLRPDPETASAELRVLDLRSGKAENVLPGLPVIDYDLSEDETEVAFTTVGSRGESEIWIGSLDRRTPPRWLARAGDQVSFGAPGTLVFRSLAGDTNALVRIRIDGTGEERLATPPVMDKGEVSPDGEWVIVHSPGSGQASVASTVAVPIRGGATKTICFPAFCQASWSPRGRFFYVGINPNPATTFPTSTLAVPIPAGKVLPDLPTSGIDLSAGGVALPRSHQIEHGWISPGPDPSTYLFTRAELNGNLYRIPLH